MFSSNSNSVNLARLKRAVFTEQYMEQLKNPETGERCYPELVHEFYIDDLQLEKVPPTKNLDLAKIHEIFGDKRIIPRNTNFVALLSYKNWTTGINGIYLYGNNDVFRQLADKIPGIVLRIEGIVETRSQSSDEYYLPGSPYGFEFDVSVACSDMAPAKAQIFAFEAFSANNTEQNDFYLPLQSMQEREEPNSSFQFHLNCSLSLKWDGIRRITEPIAKDPNAIVAALYIDDTKDFSLVAENGALVKCHGLILSAQSEVLSRMINPSNKMKESIEKRIEMGHLSENNVNRLVRYLYGMPILSDDLSCEDAVQLLQAAGLYALTHFEAKLQKMIIEKDLEWFTPNSTLELYFHVKEMESAEELREHLLNVMERTNTSLRECIKFSELVKTNAEEACSLIWKLHDMAASNNIGKLSRLTLPELPTSRKRQRCRGRNGQNCQ